MRLLIIKFNTLLSAPQLLHSKYPAYGKNNRNCINIDKEQL